jgi:hypothetical protein
MTWQPLDPTPAAAVATADPAWQALGAALRAVEPQLRAVAQAHLVAPSWRPGETAEHAAYAEGAKATWRLLLALAMRGEDAA